MALELKKLNTPIEAPVKIPKKKTINLAKNDNQTKTSTLILLIAVAVLVVALFVKFGVVDQISKLSDAQAAYDSTHAQYEASVQAVARKPEVEAEFKRYSLDWMQEGMTGYEYVERVEVLDLIESKLMGKGSIKSVVVQGDVVTVEMTDMTLKEISAMFETLVDEPIVAGVALETAETETEKSGISETETETETAAQTRDSLVFVITIDLVTASAEEEAAQ